MNSVLNIDHILNLVKKPARYINSELNSYPADLTLNFSIVLCFPDIYEIGASNLGLEILYHLINEKRIARCERVFAPDIDLEFILRKERICLFSLESKSAINKFDIVGFTIQYELVATNIINILNLSNIPVFSKDRIDSDPIVIAGGPALTNPEPFCNFFDLFVLGDGEEIIIELINLCKRFKKSNLSRKEKLIKLSYINGIYVPSLYNITYTNNDSIKSINPIYKNVNSIIEKRIVNIKSSYFPERRILPFVNIIHNRLNIELARGCLGKCRFCQASKYYFPWRERPINKVLNIIRKNITVGFEEISFSSLSCSDYKNFDKLLLETYNIYKNNNISCKISLPSLRCNKNSIKAIQQINNKKSSLTFAPEAGTNRLRNVIGKYISEEQIKETILYANSIGWRNIKLYFMIGLPTENNEDLLGISKLVHSIKKTAKNLNLIISISPFIPKAQTPFQWYPMNTIEEIKQKTFFLKKSFNDNIKLKINNNYMMSTLEALIAKGNRKFSEIIYEAWKKGARFDQWSDKLNNDLWMDVLSKHGIDLKNKYNDTYIYKKLDYKEVLPWDHLFFGTSKLALYNEYIEANKCYYKVNTIQKNNSFLKKEVNIKNKTFTNFLNEKKQNNYYSFNVLPIFRVRLCLSKTGIIRFLSHLEQIEVFKNAVRRSKLPVAYTNGLNSKIKLSYGPPLSVGQESYSEYLDIYLIKKIEVINIIENLTKELPVGFNVINAKKIPLLFPSINDLVNIMEYKIKGLNNNITQAMIKELLDNNSLIIEKVKNKKTKKINIIPLIRSFKKTNDFLKLQIRFNVKEYIKPEAIIDLLLKHHNVEDFVIERSNLFIEIKSGEIYNV
ncbi:MAG: TIGR03960 family B12-binding radical SAM protein [Endomicrobium sp.]|jgi:radical SAM family uncharacterized protein/radical SAM-linked protein|nr:TIGR03960 family B12-binding radical SAM protein [Endomicrobium sp.]